MARDPTFREACKKALGGGIPGAIAMVLQVVLLMWLRTVINVQMSTGGTFFGTIDALYKEGGIPRFYQGMWVALLQAPLSRFGDTAANAGVLSATNNWKWPIWLKTAMASLAAALWRIVIMPVDTCKTLLQVHGSAASGVMMDRMAADGIMTLYAGASAATLATFMGHYPWFATNNFLEARVASFGDSKTAVNVRRALIGFCCSFVSDCISNSTRVVKTYCQTSKEPVGYLEVTQQGHSYALNPPRRCASVNPRLKLLWPKFIRGLCCFRLLF